MKKRSLYYHTFRLVLDLMSSSRIPFTWLTDVPNYAVKHKYTRSHSFTHTYKWTLPYSHTRNTDAKILVEALCSKPEGRGFESP
jgi:hypothetical protein